MFLCPYICLSNYVRNCSGIYIYISSEFKQKLQLFFLCFMFFNRKPKRLVHLRCTPMLKWLTVSWDIFSCMLLWCCNNKELFLHGWFKFTHEALQCLQIIRIYSILLVNYFQWVFLDTFCTVFPVMHVIFC